MGARAHGSEPGQGLERQLQAVPLVDRQRFHEPRGDETVPQALSKLRKGDLATITGRLAYEVSTSNGKGYFNLVAYKVEAPETEKPKVSEEVDCPF